MKLGTLLTGALLIAGMATAAAAPVSYDGAIFDFSITPVSGSKYSLTYSADFSGFRDSSGDQGYIAAINWKIGGAKPESVILTETNALGDWGAPLLNGNMSANGCQSNGNGGQGFACLQANDWLAQATQGSLHWVFDVTFSEALTAAQLANLGNPVGALFARVDQKGNPKQAGQMGCETGNLNGRCDDVIVDNPPPVLDPRDPIGTVPEPGLAGLLGVGVLGVLMGQRRRQRK